MRQALHPVPKGAPSLVGSGIDVRDVSRVAVIGNVGFIIMADLDSRQCPTNSIRYAALQ